MPAATQQSGKKNRKYGRNRKSPSAIRYLKENRMERNKRRKIAQHERAMRDKKDYPPRVPRGTARYVRRLGLMLNQSQ